MPAEVRAKKNVERLDAADWIAKGLRVLAKSGIDAVRVEPLAKMLNVTKGSFYWHFKDRAALHNSMLQVWSEQATAGIIDSLKRNDETPEQKLHGLFTLPRRSARSIEGARLELAVRNWARKDRNAERMLHQVDKQRMDFIADAYREFGFSDEEAVARAFVFYSVLMGQAMLYLDDIDKFMDSVEERMTKKPDKTEIS